MDGNTVPLKFSGIEELTSNCNVALAHHSVKLVYKSLLEKARYEAALSLSKRGYYEDAFILVMKEISMFAYITKTCKPAERPKYLYKNCKAALELAEDLKAKLSKLYDLKNRSSCVANVRNEVATSDLDTVERNGIVSKVTGGGDDSGSTSVAETFTKLKAGDTKILLMDVRDPSAFSESHITGCVLPPSELINIPENLIRKGVSADYLEKCLPSEVLSAWSRRETFNEVVIFDSGGTDGPALTLKMILEKFDRVRYEGKILVMTGGYDGWMDAYDHFTTKAIPREPSPMKNNLVNLGAVDYNLDFDVKDEEKKYFETENITKPFSVGIPSFSRADKLVAMKKYAVKDCDEPTLLKLKELETKEALEVEKKRLQREQKLQEDMRQQKELEIDEERRMILFEESARLVSELDDLKAESKAKDELIQQLESMLEKYSKESNSVSPISQEVVDKIKDQEEKVKQLREERHILEQQQQTDRKKLTESVKPLPKIPVNHTDVSPINREIPNDRVLPPSFNRSTKPKQVIPTPIIGQSPGLSGLKNLGNTCYMNSILQCLSNNNMLAAYFTKDKYKADLNNKRRNRGKVAEQMASVIHDLWTPSYGPVICDKFRDTVGRIKAEYKTYEQQDSHEFLIFLMDWLHNDLKADDPPVTEGNVRPEVSVISNLFYGLQKSTLHCSRCPESSSTLEPISNLSLNIPDGDSKTLEDCLQLYLKKEIVSGWRCPKCKDERQAVKQTELCELPKILVIHLKRFSFLDISSKKRTTYVDFPLENLKLQTESNSSPVSYNLYAVSNHYGTMEGGHYTAYCKSPIYKRWYWFDDLEVKEVAPSSVKTNAAYILFYSLSTASNR